MEITRLQKEVVKLKDLERTSANVTLSSNVKLFELDWQLFEIKTQHGLDISQSDLGRNMKSIFWAQALASVEARLSSATADAKALAQEKVCAMNPTGVPRS